MSRQSGRLLSMGYYDNEEEPPRISYKENLFKVFRRKRGRRHSGASTVSNMSSYSCSDMRPDGHRRDRNISTSFNKKIAVGLLFIFIILMCFGRCLFKEYTSGGTCSSEAAENMDRVVDEVRTMVQALKELQDELRPLRRKLLPVADTMPNFALESQGAAVLHHLSSETYHTQPPLVTFWGLPLWYPSASPRTVIQGHFSPLTPGRCWAFAGGRGHVFVSLSHPVTITHVTLGHILSMQSPTGFAHSAPRKFSVYGLKRVDGEASDLGDFEYDSNGESLQTFKLPDRAKGVFRFVKLQIESNWGQRDFTCLYNFRVHGNLV